MKTTFNELKKYGISRIFEGKDYYFIDTVYNKEYPWPFNDGDVMWRMNKQSREIDLIGRLLYYESGGSKDDKLLDVSEFIERAS